MSYKFTFADNEVYTATDVNSITKRLVTSGVEDVFLDGVAYNVSKFNEATGKLLYTPGTVPESYASLKVTKASDTEILINPGYAFFSDGAVIEIEAGGETLGFVSGSKNYVYLQNDLINTNRCYPACSIDEPTGDYVMLAEIDENGEITDRRTYARGKLPGYQSFAGNVLRIQESIPMTKVSSYRSEGSKTFSIDNNNFEYILSYVRDDIYGNSCLGIYDIVNKSHLGFCVRNGVAGGPYYDLLLIRSPINNASSPRVEMTLSLENGELTVSLAAIVTNSGSSSSINKAYTVDLILF